MTIAGHTVASLDRAGGMLSLRIGLHGGTLADLARALGKLDGVRVTSGPQAAESAATSPSALASSWSCLRRRTKRGSSRWRWCRARPRRP